VILINGELTAFFPADESGGWRRVFCRSPSRRLTHFARELAKEVCGKWPSGGRGRKTGLLIGSINELVGAGNIPGADFWKKRDL